MSYSFIWSIDKTLSDTTTPGQSGPRLSSNKRLLCITQSSSITGASPSEFLVSYLGHSLERSGPQATGLSLLVYITIVLIFAEAFHFFVVVIITFFLNYYFSGYLVRIKWQQASSCLKLFFFFGKPSWLCVRLDPENLNEMAKYRNLKKGSIS